MDVRKFLVIARKWLWVVVLGAILGGALGLLIGFFLPRQYVAESILFINTPKNSNYYNKLGDQMAAKSFVSFPKSVAVISATIAALNYPDPDLNKFAKLLTVENVRETQFVSIKVRDSNGIRAAAIANELARQTVALSDRTQNLFGPDRKILQNNLDTLQSQIEIMQQELSALSRNPDGNQERINKLTEKLIALRGSYTGLLQSFNNFNSAKAEFWQRAEVPQTPVGSGPILFILGGLFFGTMAAAGVVYYIERNDDVLRTPEKISEVSSLTTFISVPRLAVQNRVLALATAPAGNEVASPPSATNSTADQTSESEIPEFFLNLAAFFQSRDAIAFDGQQFNVLLVTSPEVGDGKTFHIVQLALGLAHLGRSVILVDANLRAPGVHEMLGLPNVLGLSDYLAAPERYRLIDLLLPTSEPDLRVLPAGSPLGIGTELLSSPNMSELLRKLSEDERAFVLIDTSCALHTSEPLVLANRCDGVLLVIDARRTQASTLTHTLQVLSRVNSHVLGVLLNYVDS